MNKRRKETEEFILKNILAISKINGNKELYESLFKSMNDKEFDKWCVDLRDGKQHLTINSENFSNGGITVSNNLKVGDKLGHNFYQHINIGPTDKVGKYKTAARVLVMDVPAKRPSQLLTKKISIPKDNKSVNQLTGQVTGKSKGSSLSTISTRISIATGLDKSLKELLKYRGGDRKGQLALEVMIDRYGMANQEVLDQYSGTVTSTESMHTLMLGRHLKTNLNGK